MKKEQFKSLFLPCINLGEHLELLASAKTLSFSSLVNDYDIPFLERNMSASKSLDKDTLDLFIIQVYSALYDNLEIIQNMSANKIGSKDLIIFSQFCVFRQAVLETLLQSGQDNNLSLDKVDNKTVRAELLKIIKIYTDDISLQSVIKARKERKALKLIKPISPLSSKSSDNTNDLSFQSDRKSSDSSAGMSSENISSSDLDIDTRSQDSLNSLGSISLDVEPDIDKELDLGPDIGLELEDPKIIKKSLRFSKDIELVNYRINAEANDGMDKIKKLDRVRYVIQQKRQLTQAKESKIVFDLKESDNPAKTDKPSKNKKSSKYDKSVKPCKSKKKKNQPGTTLNN